MSGGGGEGPNLAAQQQAMNHGKKGGTAGYDLNSIFGRNADAATTVMQGHDVTFTHDVHMSSSMQEIIESLKSHASTASSTGGEGSGGGGAATNVSYADLGAHSGPILNTSASQQSMVELVGGKNRGSSGGDDHGSRGV